MTLRHTSMTLTALAGAIFLGGCDKPAGGGHGGLPPAAIAVVTVHPETVAMNQEYIGRGVSPYDVELRALVSGRLKERPMVDGSDVKAGDVLFLLDDVPFKAAYETAKARVDQSDAAMKNARRTYDRVKSLADTRAVSDKDLDDATNALAAAEAQLAAAKAEVEKSAWDLANTRIVAPVSGRLSKAAVVPGAPIAANQTALVRLQQTDPLWVNFSIPEPTLLKFNSEVRAGKITGGEEASIRVDLKLSDDSQYPTPGRLNFADINFRTEVSAMEARAIFPNPDRRLKPGQFFTVRLSGPKRNGVFLVPQRAVQINPTNKYVFVLAKAKGKDGKEFESVETRDVQTGEWIGDRWVIESGLKDGDRVVVEGVIGIQMRGGAGAAAVTPTEFNAAPEKPAAAPAK